MNLFGDDLWWKRHWIAMPEYIQSDLQPFHSIKVHIKSQDDVDEFATTVSQPIADGDTISSIWFPGVDEERWDKRWVSKPQTPAYPVYIVSKGRWETRMTAKALEAIGVPFRIVVEPQERDAYAAVIDQRKILVLPFSNLGQGSIPARNWIWEHALSERSGRHWILDDNISMFLRMNRNSKAPVASGAIFRAAERFVDRYENVALAGFNYDTFARRRMAVPPFYLNTRIYSCILIDNHLQMRWRGRYNEDTDLSLRALKDGRCTILFNAFQAKKTATMSMSGGNTDQLYAGDGRKQMAESLREQHPDVVQVTWRWGRWQHVVDYRGFKRNELKRKPSAVEAGGVDELGMSLVPINGEPS